MVLLCPLRPRQQQENSQPPATSMETRDLSPALRDLPSQPEGRVPQRDRAHWSPCHSSTAQVHAAHWEGRSQPRLNAPDPAGMRHPCCAEAPELLLALPGNAENNQRLLRPLSGSCYHRPPAAVSNPGSRPSCIYQTGQEWIS
ncbi:unnamed protein product [Eretmochelys imbricata]